jgi:hypothetical protein
VWGMEEEEEEEEGWSSAAACGRWRRAVCRRFGRDVWPWDGERGMMSMVAVVRWRRQELGKVEERDWGDSGRLVVDDLGMVSRLFGSMIFSPVGWSDICC